MIGIESVRSNNGCPYAGGARVEFSREDVLRLGKHTVWGSQACTQYIVNLNDGRHVFVNASNQPPEDEKFLRAIAKRCPTCYVSGRAEGWRTTWADANPTPLGYGEHMLREGEQITQDLIERLVWPGSTLVEDSLRGKITVRRFQSGDGWSIDGGSIIEHTIAKTPGGTYRSVCARKRLTDEQRALARARTLAANGEGWCTAALRAVAETYDLKNVNSESLEGEHRKVWKRICAAVRS